MSLSLVQDLLEQIEKMAVFPLVAHTNLISSREYLYVVLWELVQNAVDHSNGKNVAVAAQLFYPGELPGDKPLDLSKQYRLEERNSKKLEKRRNWLARHRNCPYLLLTCVDDGIGIPASMRQRPQVPEGEDSDLLGFALEREFSSHDCVEHYFDVHGLHLIGNLLSAYDGYLFFQSGRARLQLDASGKSSESLDVDHVLKGTSFQILLPLDVLASSYSVFHTDGRDTSNSAPPVVVAEEIRRHSIELPPPPHLRKEVVNAVVKSVSDIDRILYLDFVGMPRERHFVGLLLHCIRQRRSHFPTVVLNAPEELFSAIAGLQRFEESKSGGDPEMRQVDQGLALSLSRGVEEYASPLILPVARIVPIEVEGAAANKRRIAVQWLGLGRRGPHAPALARCLLDYLFDCEGTASEDVLESEARKHGGHDGIANSVLRWIKRSNPGLLNEHSSSSGSNEWSLAFSASQLYFDSVASLEDQICRAIERYAHVKKNDPEVIYHCNWREHNAYQSEYYEVWNVVAIPQYARMTASLLLTNSQAHPGIGAHLAEVKGIISVTPSAGLIAREIARTLRIPHWEAKSVYDLDDAEWPEDFNHEPVLMVDDLVGTGKTSRMVLECISKKNAQCRGILTLLASTEGCSSRATLGQNIVHVLEVELGCPSEDRIADARQRGNIREIDPHTLEPIPASWLERATPPEREARRNELREIVGMNGFQSGHYAYSGHHYYTFFDTIGYMNNSAALQKLESWFWDSIRTWYKDIVLPINNNEPVKRISIIYPYYSPIAAFLHEISPRIPESAPTEEVSVHVAKPYRRTMGKTGYHVVAIGTGIPEEPARFCVFIDDGIATGGTMSAIIEELVGRYPDDPSSSRNTVVFQSAILALIIFDRIGMGPRKHFRKLYSYRGGVRFDFKPLHSFNLQAFYAADCPICRIKRDIESLFRDHEHVKKHIGDSIESVDIIEPVSKWLSPTYLTGVSTLARNKAPDLLNDSDTIAAVVNANDVLFSDRATGDQIRRSISDTAKTPVARLEILRSVAMDSFLYRSVHDEPFLTATIVKLLFRGCVSSSYRKWFLLHVPYFVSHKLATKLLLGDLPRDLRAVDDSVINDGGNRVGIAEYFDHRGDVFDTLICAIWLLNNSLPKPFITDHDNGVSASGQVVTGVEPATHWDSEWRKCLSDYPLSFRLASATSATNLYEVRRRADMLLCNFATHFSRDHEESYRYRLSVLLNEDMPRQELAAFYARDMKYTVDSITRVRQYYGINEAMFPDDVLAGLLRLYDKWIRGDAESGEQWRSLVTSALVAESFIEQPETMIGRLLGELAPAITTVLSVTSQAIHQKNRNASRETGTEETLQITVGEDATALHVFCTRRLLCETLSHLVRNAAQRPGRVLRDIKMDVKTKTKDGRLRVVFVVTQPDELSKEDIENWHSAYGGIRSQKDALELFRADLSVNPPREFCIEVDAVRMER